MKQVIIIHKQALLENIEEYKRMFPQSYTTLAELETSLRNHADDYEHCGVFGISVSDEWPDKCYGFEQESNTATCATYEYMGIWKC